MQSAGRERRCLKCGNNNNVPHGVATTSTTTQVGAKIKLANFATNLRQQQQQQQRCKLDPGMGSSQGGGGGKERERERDEGRAGESWSVSGFKGRHILLPFMRFIYHTTVRSVASPLSPCPCPPADLPTPQFSARENRRKSHNRFTRRRTEQTPLLLQHMSSNQLATLPQTRLRDL